MVKNRILIVVAHPDDEVLGIGGTALNHTRKGDEVYCLILGEGLTARDKQGKTDELHENCREAGKIIGFRGLFFCKFPDNRFDSIPLLNIVKEIERYIGKIKPNIVYTHHGGDVNVDHQRTYNAVITACRPCNKDGPKEIYSFETPSSTEWQLDNTKVFVPTVFEDIEDVIEEKINAIRKYTSELRKYPHPRSEEGIKILASYRGLQSNLRFAEGLRIERMIR